MNNFGSKLSGSAVQNMIDQNTIKENTSIIELERYLVRVVQIMLQFLKLKLTEYKKSKAYLSFRAKQIIDSNNQDTAFYEIIDIPPDEFKELEADICIDASILRTSKQQKQIQDLMQLYQLEMQYAGKADIVTVTDIVKQMNLPNKQAVVRRLEQNTEQAQMMQATQLVQGVIQLMQNPEMQGLGIEQAVAMVMQQLKQGGQ